MIHLPDFFEFLSIPSISSEPAYKDEVRKCAHFVQERIKKLGLQTELWETEGHPIIFACTPHDPSKPTLLIYNHYDVQPVDPLELWETPPFTPTLKDGQVYARGAQDNKGQCYYVLEALRHIKERDGSFPLNLKLCIEGEEECGSQSLHKIVNQKKKELKADVLAIVDLGIPGIKTPAVTLGTRGLITLDIEVINASKDLHSGSHGGLAFNPIHALVKILSEARDAEGHITIPGFYDDIQEFSEEERKNMLFTFDDAQYARDFGTNATGGELTFSPIERNWLRPTLEVNGITGGYTGDGFKTVIPSKASAKVSCRIVPNQSPKNVAECVRAYFEKKAPPGTKVTVHLHGEGGEAARANPHSPGVQAFAKAYSEVFGKPCQFIFEGASIPIIPKLAAASEAEPVLLGLGLITDCIHAPNEHFGVDRLEMGAQIIVKAIDNLAKLKV
jgi:acetylornithine deacetylase/succinyl-diaminopimelate desuccinylase-like protein